MPPILNICKNASTGTITHMHREALTENLKKFTQVKTKQKFSHQSMDLGQLYFYHFNFHIFCISSFNLQHSTRLTSQCTGHKI